MPTLPKQPLVNHKTSHISNIYPLEASSRVIFKTALVQENV